MRAMTEHEVPEIHHQVKREYYSTGREAFQVRQDSEADPFAFAVTLTSYEGYKRPAGQEKEDELVDESMEFKMRYLIQGNEDRDDGKTFEIGFKKCAQADWDKFHLDDNDKVNS